MDNRQLIGTSSCPKSTVARRAGVRYCLLAWEEPPTTLTPRKLELNLRSTLLAVCIHLISPLHPSGYPFPREEFQVWARAASLNQIVHSFGLSRVLSLAGDHDVHLRPARFQRAQSPLRTKQQ